MGNRRKTIRKISSDTIINIVSYGIPILMLQFVIFPFVARYWHTNDYGLMLALTSIVGVASEMAGGTLSNVRLILNNQYEENANGDYKSLLFYFNTIIGCVLCAIFSFYYGIGIIQVVLLLGYFLLFSFHSYLSVGYRLELKYNLVFINNVILCMGYGAGMFVAYILKQWEYVYICGLLVSCLHLLLTTKVWRGSFKRTKLFNQSLLKSITLMGAYLVGNSMNYFDRVFLYALMGALVVSEYYTATVFGKILNLLITPINMVMLSYLSKKTTLSRREIVYCLSALVIVGGCFVLTADYIAPTILSYLYPQYYKNILDLILLATLATTITACTSLFKTLSMRYVSGGKVLSIECVYIAVYISTSIAMIKHWGLTGFCIATIVAAGVRILLYLICLLLNENISSHKNIVNV